MFNNNMYLKNSKLCLAVFILRLDMFNLL